MDSCELLARYIELHNEAAGGEEDLRTQLFADGMALEVEGDALSRLRREAILERFRSEELVLWEIGALDDGSAFAKYAWRRHPQLGGVIQVMTEGDHITRMTLRPGRSRLFAMLSTAPPPPISDDGPNAFHGD
jgi:hypothetical protein